jgi:hypothetical protein
MSNIWEGANNMTALDIKSELLRVLETLPPGRQAQVLEYACFLHEQARAEAAEKVTQPPGIEVRAVPAATLLTLTGLVALGGDAVAETEALYGSDCAWLS